MKGKLDELYIERVRINSIERDKINSEIEKIKRMQQVCEHIFTPSINDPEIKDRNLIKKCYRRCVICGKVEYSYAFKEYDYESEYSFKRKI